MTIRCLVVLACIVSLAGASEPATAYFADGYHGGVYGHYPAGYTGFLVEQLKANPDWKINLEIEPETWDVVRVSEPAAYAAFKAILADQSDAGHIEIVNPTYAQSYLFQSSGESLIRQFDHGIRKLREHFPNAVFTTYSSEEPCFTSCLPPVLKSFGFKFAVLKNPDTCWGGYTTTHGGELVNWIGPDGTSILTVPRYACESLQPQSCWQTIAFRNSPDYLKACFEQGIKHPVGMCLQDAGWRGGPWIGSGEKTLPVPSKYVTWRDYFHNITPTKTADDWHFTQEDLKPGLMWGAQVLQRIAQQSREAERRLLVAEKLGAMAFVAAGQPPRTDAFDEAWHDVLLSQHHDCWIVPYNGPLGNTWADQVRRWTTVANAFSEQSSYSSIAALLNGERSRGRRFVRLFNSTAAALDAVVPVPIPETHEPSKTVSLDSNGRYHPTQIVKSDVPGQSTLLVRANVPPIGYATVELHQDAEATDAAVTALITGDSVVMESEFYRIEFDSAKGGTIRSLVARMLGNREFVDNKNEHLLNELRGHFYERGGFHSSADQTAKITVVENGPLRATVNIVGTIAGNPFVQRVSITQGSPVIECSVRIDWQGNPRIGQFEEKDGWRNRRRPAYNDRFKLLALFPTKLARQKISKSAPFDVCESKLDDTFYDSWDAIKNNVILDWVDVTDGQGDYGLALFSDHTTSYTHGANFPLGLTLQYAGKGLWARDYRVSGRTEVRYALMPHAGHWDQADVPAASAAWQEPVLGAVSSGSGRPMRSLIDPGNSGWEIPAMFERDGDLVVRIFNAAGDGSPQEIRVGFEAGRVELVELDDRVIEDLDQTVNANGDRSLRLQIPRFGIRTLRFSKIKPPASMP
jgi:alpha-mannosidase